ncbi:MAG TPA: hypothetical protein VIV40_04865 [Kofleriaceae bacterium]
MATSFPITSWLRAFFALQQYAMDSRGVMEIPDDDEGVIRWPRTPAADVHAIVAMLDPILKHQPLRYGGHGLGRRWRGSIDALAHHAPDAEYADNRTFWRALPAVCVYLHSQSVPLPPPEIWNALIARFCVTAAVA